ncbi:hypothetical protein ONZ45_g15752 [Pleurotus djamor]|nr:hypothetical protein ONZ45_g15752 [Pleurotus djamor]
MFLKPSDHASYLDISSALRDRQDWNVASLRSFIYYADISAHVYDPISGLLAIGTSQGTIALFGSPGVQCQISLREPVAVKFVQFASSLNRLVCLDANNDLHLWDLEDLLQNLPKHLGTAKFDEASALTVSPCHSHAFITLQSGVVRTYDIACLRKSPYVAPNMWSLYKEKMIASGMPDLGIPDRGYRALRLGSSSSLQTPASSTSNLEKTERNSLRVYELILSPGAPGGAGYDSEDLLTHRKPSVMTMATHPSGHFFAAGYSDGSIAYWAVEDEDQPLMVRTLDDVDVDVVDAEKLDKYLPSGGLPTQGRGSKVQASARDPIFKLTWSGFSNSSDPRGGHTTLTILGGTFPDDAPGLIVHYLPPFNPPEPPATPANRPDQLPTFFRNAMRDSVVPSATYFYATNTIVQDYLLVPGNTPHFGGAYDPMSILLLCEGAGGTRILEARQFPPPTFTDKEAEPETEGDGKAVENTDVEDLLVETLRSMQMSSDPDSLALPLPLDINPIASSSPITTTSPFISLT